MTAVCGGVGAGATSFWLGGTIWAQFYYLKNDFPLFKSEGSLFYWEFQSSTAAECVYVWECFPGIVVVGALGRSEGVYRPMIPLPRRLWVVV